MALVFPTETARGRNTASLSGQRLVDWHFLQSGLRLLVEYNIDRDPFCLALPRTPKFRPNIAIGKLSGSEVSVPYSAIHPSFGYN